MTWTKTCIVERLLHIGFTRKKSSDVLETLLEIIKKTLEKKEGVLISRFGKFTVKEVKNGKTKGFYASQGHAMNGEKIVIFRCSPVFCKKINREPGYSIRDSSNE